MEKFLKKLQEIRENPSIKKKIIFTLLMLALYRLLVFVPVPFVDITELMARTINTGDSGVGYFIMLLGGSLDQFALIAVGLAPFINASIIMQLLGSVVPKLEELTEQGESGQQKIQQYTRYLSVPLAFLQSIGMVFFINYLLGGAVISTAPLSLIITAFTMTVGSVLLMWIGELITEKGVSNGVSMLIFASIVAGITQQIYGSISGSTNFIGIILFMLIIVLGLVLLSIFILKSIKEIPIIYARRGKVEESSSLPIPMNPVGMIPIIFSIAFVSFPYLLSKLITQFQPMNTKLVGMANWIEVNLNIYTQQPGIPAIILYFILIIVFTFFYTLIVFSPERISDNIQKRGGFIPGIRPGKETAKYINGILMHLCFWGGAGLAFIGIYSYILNYIPFVQTLVQSLGSLPVVVTGSGVIIIVGVVQEIMSKVKTDLLMQRYDKIDLGTVSKNLHKL
ncbi:MAG TPA: preprotein translocase subunit SecY [Candidatus Absconditabacterales bacterium]|nr:preprotein translocase subunit SecY [Candidatus Absconditabacterales bacterium]